MTDLADGSRRVAWGGAVLVAAVLTAILLRPAGDPAQAPSSGVVVIRGDAPTIMASGDSYLVAAIDGGVRAILVGTDGRRIAVSPGMMLAPGVRVVAIDAASVTLDRAGIRERLPAPEGAPPPDDAYRPATAGALEAPAALAEAERSGRWPAASTANPVPAP